MTCCSTVLLFSQIKLWPLLSCGNSLRYVVVVCLLVCVVVCVCVCVPASCYFRYRLRVSDQPDVKGSVQAPGGLCV